MSIATANPSLRGATSVPALHPVTQHSDLILPDMDTSSGGQKYSLDKIIGVDGRQGIATNGTHYFVSSSTALFMYDLEGNLLHKNEEPLHLPQIILVTLATMMGNSTQGLSGLMQGVVKIFKL